MAFFNEINPVGICEMHFVREIWLGQVKCAAAREGFISFHIASTDAIFHNFRKKIISP